MDLKKLDMYDEHNLEINSCDDLVKVMKNLESYQGRRYGLIYTKYGCCFESYTITNPFNGDKIVYKIEKH